MYVQASLAETPRVKAVPMNKRDHGLYFRSYFFDDGILFECQKCGGCCTGQPGIVHVNETEISQIARFLSLPVSKLVSSRLYPYKDGYSILEDHQGRCLFYEQGCTIYNVRPLQCKTYPFWFVNMRNETKWNKVERECPGIGEGRLFTKEAILRILNQSF